MRTAFSMQKAWIAGMVFSVMVSATLSAPPLRIERLDLGLAEELALQNDLTLRARRAALDVARMQMMAAWGIEDPELRVSYGETESPSPDPLVPDSQSEDYRVALRLFPPNPWIVRGNRTAARSAVRAEEAAVRLAEWEVVIRVRQLYAQVLYLREDMSILQELMDAQARYREFMKEMHSGGEVTSLINIAAGLDYLDTVADRDEVRQLLRQATSELEAITGTSELGDARFMPETESLKEHVSNLDLRSLQAMALQVRPDVAILTWELGAAESGAAAAGRRRLPWFSHVQLEYGEEQGDREDEGWGVQAAVNLPVFSYMTAGEEDVLKADAVRLRAELLAVRATVEREVQVAWHTVQAALENEAEYRSDIEPLLKELEAALATREGQSEIAIEMEMQVREGIAKSRRAQIQSEFSLKEAILVLEQSLGTDLPR